MRPDVSYLSAEEEVVNLLIQAAGYMSEIYKRAGDPGLRPASAISPLRTTRACSNGSMPSSGCGT